MGLKRSGIRHSIGSKGIEITRRRFLNGVLLFGSSVGLHGCDGFFTTSNEDHNISPDVESYDINLGSGDVSLLNYFFLLEQLGHSFYSQTLSNRQFEPVEINFVESLRNHEAIHLSLFKSLLSHKAIPNLTFNFSTVVITDYISFLQAAESFENVTSRAYKGAAKFFEDVELRSLAVKFSIAELVHELQINQLLRGDTSDFKEENGKSSLLLGDAMEPDGVLASLQPYIIEKIKPMVIG
jgi:hypothetical protein